MNCTDKEFESKIFGVYPHKFMSLDVAPAFCGFSNTLFALDTNGECQLPFASRMKLATHVWQDGAVVKDVNGLFGGGPIGVASITLPGGKPQVSAGPAFIYVNGVPVDFTEFSYDPMTLSNEKLSLKCICGSHSTGSNRHSSWCDIKETA